MTAPIVAPQRLHALDNLRALMMWLGIVLHAGVNYTVMPSPLPWHDDRSTPVADVLLAFIHAFRMPVFFILAGFFAALLLARRGPAGLARHRLRRLALPFALFWPPLFLASGVLVLLYLHRMAHGTWGIDPGLLRSGPTVPQAGPNTMHLWFLWMLLWFCLATALLARWPLLPRAAWARAAALLQHLGRSGWGSVALTLPLVAAGWHYPQGLLVPNGSFLPPLAEWLHNGMFFAFGLALHGAQGLLFAHYREHAVRHVLGGVAFFVMAGMLVQGRASAAAIAFTYNATTWLWSFALIGLALRWLPRPRPALAYLAGSAYWVYLVHLPLTIGFGALMWGLSWPAAVKMLLNIVATTALCLASYQVLVRGRTLGRLLGGAEPERARKLAG